MRINEDRLFINNSQADFRDFLSDEKLFLQEHNKEYKKLLDKVSSIKNNNPKIQQLYDGKIISFSDDDCKKLQESINLQYKLIIIWEKHLYYAGIREAIALEEQIYMRREWKKGKII